MPQARMHVANVMLPFPPVGEGVAERRERGTLAPIFSLALESSIPLSRPSGTLSPQGRGEKK